MSDTNKWIASARVSLDELDKLCKWQRNQRVQLLVQVDDLEKEVKRLREQLTSADKMIREMIRESRDTPREAYVSGSAREAEQLFVHVLEANWDEVIE